MEGAKYSASLQLMVWIGGLGVVKEGFPAGGWIGGSEVWVPEGSPPSHREGIPNKSNSCVVAQPDLCVRHALRDLSPATC